MRNAIFVGGIVCSILGQTAFADNWPRFRGPNGAGISDDKTIPLIWSASENVLWKTAVPGIGNSSPIVWGDRIFLESAPTVNERRLYCLNVADGKILWSESVPGTKANLHKLNTLASSTPATDGERVYALYWDGSGVSVHAYDFQGKHLWKHDLGPFVSQHGVGASPIVYKGKVYINNDMDAGPGRTSRLVALDAKTGDVAWEAGRFTHRACYSTPFIHERKGQPTELICASTGGVTGYDPDTGAEKWKWSWPEINPRMLRTVGSPILAQGMVLAISGDGSGERHTVAVRKGDKGDVTQTNMVWNYKKAMPYVPTPLARGDYFYLVTDSGLASCLEIQTGKFAWADKRLGSAVTASPVMIDGKVFVVGENGETTVYEATPSGFEVLAKNELGEEVKASPAVANGRLYIRGKNHLFCIGKR
jgi:outer membrane protein assembly factor BamB